VDGGDGPEFYVFQNESDSLIYYSFPSDPWGSRKQAGGEGRAHVINLTIGLKDGTYFVAANAVG
jgi:hypothetical protein